MRRKEQLLDITGKETIKKEVKDFDDEFRRLSERVNESKKDFLDENRLQQNIKDLKAGLRVVLEEDKNINQIMNKNLSAE